ncbi:threonine/serine exporter family protein [uncultured Actinomyces sp.]|uniref:threonine/serine exporter family protein n=1 Tax=uncultured Actinomyces sp. TaxID=249061 RepID=UPI0025F4FAC9|nr:threonine/serine exporter family protein [uncultured Actinomyces sp.]
MRPRAVRTAALLLDSGQSTHDAVAAVERLNELLGTRFTLLPAWSQVALADADGPVAAVRSIRPVSVHMGRATLIQHRLSTADRLTLDELEDLLEQARARPASPTWLFALAAGLGASLLALIFGAHHPPSVALVFAAAGAGGRALAGRATAITQTFAAALIGGLVGALAVRLGWTGTARLVAVCPGMVLVPGPQVLNGAIEIAERRHDMGLARLADAALTILAISAGVVGGLLIGGTGLPLTATTSAIPLWLDALAAAVLAMCYPVYFSMPLRTFGWAFLAGGLAHAAHWVSLTWWHWNAPAASLLACLVAGGLLTPVCRSRHIPFAGAGFAAVVALVPGVYLFRTAAGTLSLLSEAHAEAALAATASDLATAVLIVLAMAVGLVVPYRVWARLAR